MKQISKEENLTIQTSFKEKKSSKIKDLLISLNSNKIIKCVRALLDNFNSNFFNLHQGFTILVKGLIFLRKTKLKLLNHMI